MKHITPELYNVDIRACDHQKLIDLIQEKMSLEHYGTRISPYLLTCEQSLESQISMMHEVLQKAIKVIVENYLVNKDISDKLPLPSKHLKLIKLASQKPYRIFSIRPDFLISETGEIKLCEINARFTANGFIGAHWIAQAFSKKHNNPQQDYDILARYLSRFDQKKPLFLLRDSERGYDLNLLAQYMQKNDYTVYNICPDDLSLNQGQLYANGTHCQQIVFELLQSELDDFAPDVLEALIQQSNYVNDIRTILLVHDKRFFSLLSDENLMSKYLSDHEVALLAKHIIKTYSLSTVADQVLKNPQQWVLKKCLSGKGEGMYIGADTDVEQLAEVVDNLSEQYIAQPFLKQKQVEIDIDGQMVDCYVVGMILSLNGQFCGSGFFRASAQKIIAVSRGGVIVVPSYQ